MSVDRQKLKRTTFKPATDEAKRRLIVCVQGLEKRGKSHWALTAPDPIAYMSLDIGTEGVVNKFINGELAAKEIYLSTYRNFVKRNSKGEVDTKATGDQAEKEWGKFVKDYETALDMGVRTVIVDTGSEMWELLRLSAFGKLDQVPSFMYGPVNGAFRELVRQAYDNDTNLILIHKYKKQYKGSEWSGKFERAGFGDVGYLSQVVVECERKPIKKNGEGGEFVTKVLDCRQNANLVGEEYEEEFSTFQMLACDVIQGSTPDEWE